MSSALDDLENYRIQLEQVEAALIAEPNNEELLKLKADLNEIIQLQQDIVAKDEPSASSAEHFRSAPVVTEKISWKIGDRCLASSKNGNKQVAVIDGISQDKVAITFAGTGVKHMVRTSELQAAPADETKNYLFPSNKASSGPKKEWQLERERRKARAQKKEQRRKQIDESKEQDKNKWLSFNAKANAKKIKGIKRVEASGSASDGPKAGPSRQTIISSRKDQQTFGANQRGREIMDSLF